MNSAAEARAVIRPSLRPTCRGHWTQPGPSALAEPACENVCVFERFTDRARRVLVLAQEEARLLNHSFIGTEHILLGLIHEQEGIAAKALESLGVSLGPSARGSMRR